MCSKIISLSQLNLVNGSRCRKVTINDTNENNHIDKRKTMKRNVPTRKLTKKTNIEFCKSTKVPFREDIKAFKVFQSLCDQSCYLIYLNYDYNQYNAWVII